MNKNIRRGMVALATAFVCVVALASPASATTATGEVTGGTITLINSTGTVTDTITLGGGTSGGTGCSSSITAVTNTTTTSTTTWQITGFATVGRFKLGTTWYVAALTRTNSTAGTVTSVTTTTATLNSATLNLNAVISNTTFQADTDTSCTTSGAKCRFSSVAISLQGTYSGNIDGIAISDTIHVTGTGTLGTTTPPCTTPFTTYNAGTVTGASITAHVVSVTP